MNNKLFIHKSLPEMYHIEVDKHNKIYVEVSGKKDGIPVIFIHGGPGGHCRSEHHSLFDPNIFRSIIFDQRGCGKSTPYGACENNTTHDLISDIKLILSKLNIEKVNIYGGSWGSTLALLFAETYPHLVHSLVLRGIFLCRKKDIQWFYQRGANSIYPD